MMSRLWALLLLVFCFPIWATLVLIIRFHLGSPVFFRQSRPGLRGKSFIMFKFRTMRDACDLNGKVLPDALRITRLGSFLRSTSLDELPELINILRGEMAFVGPRPLLIEYLPLYSTEQMRRHEVLPGITGWAQVNGRNAISWEEKFKFDVWYVENQTLWLDLKIISRTFAAVILRDGITSQGSVSASPFIGNNKESKMEAL